jgi:hypothetical protein
VPDPEESVPIREYVDRRLADKDLRDQQRYDAQTKALEAAMVAADKAVQAALLAAEKAVNKAEVAAERRFESVNEFRAQLGDQAKTFMPRSEYEVQHSALADKMEAHALNLSARIDQLAKQVSEAAGDLNVYRADVEARRGARNEQRTQSNWSTGMLVTVAFSVVAAIVGVAGILLALLR